MSLSYSAVFDIACFDYSYFDITNKKYGQFLNAHTTLFNSNKELVTFIRTTNTVDGEGVITNSVETTDTDVEVFILPLTEEDRKLTGRGISEEGSIKIIANRSYDLTNNGNSVKFSPGDKIIRTSDGTNNEWCIESINRNYGFGGEIFRTCFLKKINA